MSEDHPFRFDPDDDSVSPSPAAARSRPDAEDLAARFGGDLFALAYHLSGDAGQAAALALRVIAGHGLGPDAADTDLGAVSIDLYRNLLASWRSGYALQRRARGAPPGPGAPGVAATLGPLHRALDRLDPDARLVTVLRVAEGLDYEEIAVLLRLPGPHVRGALVTGRRLLQAAMHGRSIDPRLEAAMTLYLDSRLSGPDLAEFQSLLSGDIALRRAVEFQRGLTLEFREEVPPPPADLVRRVGEEHRRLLAERAAGRAAGAALGARAARRRVAILAGAGTVLVAVLFAWFWRARLDGADRRPVEPAAQAEKAEGADEETVEVLRSLGYVAGSKEVTRSETGRTPAPVPTKRPKADLPAGAPAPEAGLAQEAGPTTEAVPPAEPASSPEPTLAPEPAPQPAAPETLPFRAVAVDHAPEVGRDHLVIRTAEEWAGFAGEAPAPADFAAEMVIVLRDDLGNQPPVRLIVEEVRVVAGTLEIAARVAETPAAAAPGQGIVVPATDRPIQLVIH